MKHPQPPNAQHHSILTATGPQLDNLAAALGFQRLRGAGKFIIIQHMDGRKERVFTNAGTIEADATFRARMLWR